MGARRWCESLARGVGERHRCAALVRGFGGCGRGCGPADALYVRDLANGAETRVAVIGPRRVATEAWTSAGRSGEAAIAGDLVAYVDHRPGNGDIWVYDLATGLATAVRTGRWAQDQPAISGHTVVWVDSCDNTYGFSGPYYLNGTDVFGCDLDTGRVFPVCRAADDQLFPAISGPIVVWQDGRHRTAQHPDNSDIYGMDLRTGREFSIATGPLAETHPAVSGNVVLWTERYGRAPAAGERAPSLIMGRDPRSGRTFVVSDQPGPYDNASISGDIAVWCSPGREASQLAVFGARIDAHGTRPVVELLRR